MRRAGLVAALLIAAAIWPASAGASGGTYTLVQCDPLNRAADEATLKPTVSYAVRPFCGESEHGFAIRIENVLKAHPDRAGGLVYWEAPPGTSIVGVTAQVQLRNDSGHRARVFIADGEGREVRRIANGETGSVDWRDVDYNAVADGHERFAVSLSCQDEPNCPASDKAKALVRNVRITLVDEKDPVLDRVDGSLFDGGWLRGEQSIGLQALDSESGLTRISVGIAGAEVREFQISCAGSLSGQGVSSEFHPCPDERAEAITVDTRVTPFQDGLNSVQICAYDFALNSGCPAFQARVDNTPPSLAFAPDQPADDPELIRVSATDVPSGLTSGQILFRQKETELWQPIKTTLDDGYLVGRVDSSAQPPGAYEFLARGVDKAGNTSETSLTTMGQPKVLQFPLRSGMQLSARMEPGGSKRRTVGYGRPGHVAGKLLSASGQPLAHRDVEVVEHFGDGALLSKRKRTVSTDGHGNWSERVPPGPSRRVTASFEGDQRYLGVEKQAGNLFVRSKAVFRTSRRSLHEGKKIVFKGKVGHLGAHIPPGGKLVEVQVRERPGRWNTVRQALYTNGAGKYRMSYRFGRFYVKNARFHFRVKVTREQGWPYKAPINSRKRTVIVRAHK